MLEVLLVILKKEDDPLCNYVVGTSHSNILKKRRECICFAKRQGPRRDHRSDNVALYVGESPFPRNPGYWWALSTWSSTDHIGGKRRCDWKEPRPSNK